MLPDSSSPQKELRCFWHTATDAEPDTYVAFRGTFDLTQATTVEFNILGAAWFVVWLDGTLFTEGPARFSPSNPEYQTYRVRLETGRHVLAVQVHHLGVTTRILNDVTPFFWCIARADGEEVEVQWKAQSLEGYTPQVSRINAQLGWIEWCDTRQVPQWQPVDYDDSQWSSPHLVTRALGEMKPLSTDNTQFFVQAASPVAQGKLAEIFGYEKDNPSARFFCATSHPFTCRLKVSGGATIWVAFA